MSDSGKSKEECFLYNAFYDLILEVTVCNFCHILSLSPAHTEEVEIGPALMEKYQRTCGHLFISLPLNLSKGLSYLDYE